MKRVIAILVLLCFSISIRAQTTPSVVTMQNAATATGNGTAIVVGVSAANPGANLGAVGVQIVGTFSATITFEATTDGTNWTPVMATNLEDDVRATTATAAGQYTILYGSAIRIRARISSYSSGLVTVKGRLIPGLTARLTSGGGGGGGGTGDVVGPASATDNAVARFNLTTGKLIQNSVVTIADSTGNMAGVGTINTHTIPSGTDTFTMNAATQTLDSKTLTTPTIADFQNATHNHSNAAGGGQIAISSGISGLGTGVATFLGTPSSANLAAALTDETGGSGLAVFNSTPTIITPSFTTGFTIGGTAASGTIPRGNGTNFVASAFTMAVPGTTGNVLTSDGTNWTSAAPAGGGIGSLGGQTGNAQTFSRTNDTNVTLTISSATDDHNFALGWTGTLAKARQHANTVYTDQANTFGNFIQTLQAGGNFLLSDPTDTTKKAQFDVSNVATSTTRTVNIPNANSTTVQADTGASNQFLTAISAQGVISKAQPSFSNISGSVADGQLSSNVFYVDGTRTGNSSATTGSGFAFDALSLTSGIAQRWRVPSSGFTGSILRVTDNAGSPVTLFEVDETGAITTGSIPYSAVSSKSVVNADVNASAAIAYSKLNLSGSIVNADINASAAIADTKLATISTAGKVSDSALSSNVTLGGNTFSGTGSILRATSPTATNATINQAANNNTALTSVRATDTSPTGNFLLFRNAANNTDLWAVDIAGSLTAGDVPAARLSGTIADARFPATLPAVSGANLTNLNASNLASGTVPLARLSGITNTEISGSAAIAYSKLAALTTSRALVSDGSGVISVSSVTATELGHLSGVTSAIQTQLNAKAASSITLTAGVGISGGGDLSANRSFALDLTELVNNQTLWDSSNATRTLTAGLSGATDPVITFGDSSVDVTTGTLKQGGTAVSLAGHAHAASDITSGALAIARGGTGTGTAPGDGKLLIGKTDGTYAVANLTAGSNITITNGDGTIQIASSGGAGGYATVQEEGTGLTQRATLNFVGSAFTAADDSGNSRTNVTSDSDVDALASNSTNGLWARTGSGTGAARTITGTTNVITVTNGDGVSGNPTLNAGSLVVLTNQANTWSTGAQDFGSATSLKVPTSAGAAPTTDGLIAYDTTADMVVAGQSGATIQLSLYDVSGYVLSKPGSSQVIVRFVAPRAFNLPTGTISNGTNAPFKAGTAATAQADFTLSKNGGAAFCTLRFAASGTQATYQSCTATDFASGDVLTITAPSSQDATLADLGVTLPGKLK